MKVVFLDIDGVLNTSKTFIDRYNEYKQTGNMKIEIDEFRVKYLADIIKETNSKIVLSSSWRIFWDNNLKPKNTKAQEFEKILNKYELKIYSKTDYLGIEREKEIDEWLRKHDNIENFIIIDDESFDLQKYVGKNLIKTIRIEDDETLINNEDCIGLTECDVRIAIYKLKS